MKISVIRLDHVQICIPAGKENEARDFYGELLGLKEIEKPESLKKNGGLWYEIGDIQLHIGTEDAGDPKGKRHPAFQVQNLDQIKAYLKQNHVVIKEDIPIPNIERFSFFDPFGNRVELLEKG